MWYLDNDFEKELPQKGIAMPHVDSEEALAEEFQRGDPTRTLPKETDPVHLDEVPFEGLTPPAEFINDPTKDPDPEEVENEPDPTVPEREDVPVPTAPAELGAEHHYYCNIKVVSWIPYRPSGSDLPPAWHRDYYGHEYTVSSRKIGPVEEQLMKELFAVGNPTPPDDFRSEVDFKEFVAGREYRSIYDIDLYACCGGQAIPRHDARKRNRAGFTPAASDVPEGQVHEYHKNHECLSSKIERKPLAWNPLVPPEDVSAPYQFAPGNSRDPDLTIRTTAGEVPCLFAGSKVGFQVNNLENRGFYAASGGYILPYMWVGPLVRLCCGGELTVVVAGSGMPSSKLYINNKKVASYNMLDQLFPEIRRSLYTGGGNVASPQDAPYAKISTNKPLMGHVMNLGAYAGCPVLTPSFWLHPGN